MGYDLTNPEDRQRARAENPGWIVDDSGMYNPNTGQEVNSSGEVVRDTGPAFTSSTPAAPAGFSGPNGSLYGQMYQNAAYANGAAAPGGTRMAPPVTPQAQPARAGQQTGPQYTGLNNGQPLPPNTGVEEARQLTRYDTSDPLRALRSAMLDMGINLGSPYGATLQRLAPGLANAFRVTNAMGTSPPADQFNEPDMFRRYLASVLTGAGSGTPFGALRSAAGIAQSPGFSSALVNTENLRAADQNAPINPFMRYLLDAGLLNNPQSMAGLLTSLVSPFMSPHLAQSYGNALVGRGEEALQRSELFGAGNAGGTSNDAFYRFIMGIP